MHGLNMVEFRRLSGLDEGFSELRLPTARRERTKRSRNAEALYENIVQPKKRSRRKVSTPASAKRRRSSSTKPHRAGPERWSRREMQYRLNELGRMCEELALENGQLKEECTALRGQLAHIKTLLEGREQGPRGGRKGRQPHPTLYGGTPQRGPMAVRTAPDPLPGLAEVIAEEGGRPVATGNSPLQHEITPGDLAPTPGVPSEFQW